MLSSSFLALAVLATGCAATSSSSETAANESALAAGVTPLYTFAGDAAPGDVNGDGLGGVWHLARPATK